MKKHQIRTPVFSFISRKPASNWKKVKKYRRFIQFIARIISERRWIKVWKFSQSAEESVWINYKVLDKMKKLIISTFLILHSICVLTTHISEERYVHINDDLSENRKPLVIKNTNKDLVEDLHTRYRRDINSDRNEGFKNITTRVIILFFHYFSTLIILKIMHDISAR